MTASETLAAFVAQLSRDAIPPAAIAKVLDHLLDTIGVACGGVGDRVLRPVVDTVMRWGGSPEAAVIGTCARLPAPKAAFVNALHARIHAFDDTYEPGPSHPGSAVVSAALAAAESAHASLDTFIAALVAGYEVAARVSLALGASHYGAGFHTTGTALPFGAAAAAARALGLDAARTACALGLAGEAAIGLRQYQIDGSMLDTAQNGARAAELGVAAAAFAADGAAGPRGILDGRYGVLNVLRGSADGCGLITSALGERWEWTQTHVKPYASCRYTHGPIAVLHASKLDPERIVDIEIATFRASVEVADRPLPRKRMEAILSHQLAAALALRGRPIVPSALDTPGEAALALAQRVRVRHDPALDAMHPPCWPHRIVVTMRDGERMVLSSDQPPAADRAAIRAKFVALASPVLGTAAAERAIFAVDGLDRAAGIEPLLRLLYVEPDGSR